MSDTLTAPSRDMLEDCGVAPASAQTRQRIQNVITANPEFSSIQVWEILADKGPLVPLTEVIGGLQGL